MASQPIHKKSSSGRFRRLGNVIMIFVFAVVSLAVLGGFGIWFSIRVHDEKATNTSSEASDEASIEPSFSAEDARDLLVAVDDNNSLCSLSILRMDPEGKKCDALAVPVNTVVQLGTNEKTLSRLYREEGLNACKEAAAKLFQMPVTRAAVLSCDSVAETVNSHHHGLVYAVPQNMQPQSTDGAAAVALTAGLKTLTGAQTVQVLRYAGWEGGQLQQSSVQADLLAAYINQVYVPSSAASLRQEFIDFVNRARSDLRASDFGAYEPKLSFLVSCNKSGKLCTSIPAAGEFVGTGDDLRFYYDVKNKTFRDAFPASD